MTYYYVDPTATGDNDGGGDGTTRADPTDSGNWTNAWESFADAIAGTNGTAPSAGDVVIFKAGGSGADESLGSSTTITQSINGNNTTGLIYWVAVNSSGANDGTRYVIDGQGSNGGAGLYVTGGYNWFENFEIDDSDSYGLHVTGGSNTFRNCYIHHSDYYGVYVTQNYNTFIQCLSTHNGWDGFYVNSESFCLFCNSNNNASEGFYFQSVSNVAYGCIAYDNSHEGFEVFNRSNRLINCIADGNSLDNVLLPSTTSYNLAIIGLRSTDSGEYGIDNNNQQNVLYIGNYIPDTGQDEANTGGVYTNWHSHPSILASFFNVFDGTDADAGYTAKMSENYSLTDSASLRRTAITIPIT